MEQQEPAYFEKTEDMLRKYLGDRIMLLKLKVSEQSSKIASLLFVGVVLVLLGFFLLLFISILAGIYFSELTGSYFYGFGIVTGFYLLLLLVILLIRKKYLVPYITNMVIRNIFDKSNDDDDNISDNQSPKPDYN